MHYIITSLIVFYQNYNLKLSLILMQMAVAIAVLCIVFTSFTFFCLAATLLCFAMLIAALQFFCFIR